MERLQSYSWKLVWEIARSLSGRSDLVYFHVSPAHLEQITSRPVTSGTNSTEQQGRSKLGSLLSVRAPDGALHLQTGAEIAFFFFFCCCCCFRVCMCVFCFLPCDRIGLRSERHSVETGFFRSETRPNRCLLYTSPSPRDASKSRMPSSA